MDRSVGIPVAALERDRQGPLLGVPAAMSSTQISSSARYATHALPRVTRTLFGESHRPLLRGANAFFRAATPAPSPPCSGPATARNRITARSTGDSSSRELVSPSVSLRHRDSGRKQGKGFHDQSPGRDRRARRRLERPRSRPPTGRESRINRLTLKRARVGETMPRRTCRRRRWPSPCSRVAVLGELPELEVRRRPVPVCKRVDDRTAGNTCLSGYQPATRTWSALTSRPRSPRRSSRSNSNAAAAEGASKHMMVRPLSMSRAKALVLTPTLSDWGHLGLK